MASKIAALRAKFRTVQEGTKRTAMGALRSGETLVAGGLTAYAAGRFSDANGKWGFRGVPYAYIGGGILILSGAAVGFTSRTGEGAADLMAIGTGMVGAELFPWARAQGVANKNKATTTSGGRTIGRTSVPAGLGSKFANMGAAARQAAQPQAETVDTGSAFQRAGNAGAQS